MTSTPTARRAFRYLRQSPTRDPELGIERQDKRTAALVEARGWIDAGKYVDEGVSASKARGQGTAWARMLADAQPGDVIVGVDLDRVLRTTGDLNTLIDHGLAVVTVDGEIDLTTADGEFRATMLAAIARFEVRRKGERQSRAMAQRVERGIVPAGVRLTGYAQDGSVIAAEAELVRDMFARFVGGDSLHAIATRLNATGVTTRRGGLWRPSSVRTILTNPRYAGRQVYKGEETGHLGEWEPLVSEATFETARAILSDPRRVTNREGTDRKHLGAGLYRCGVCVARVEAGEQDAEQRLVSHGTPTRYRCRDYGHVTRSATQIDQYVTQAVARWLDSPAASRIDLTPPSDDEAPAAVEVRRQRERLAQVERDYDNDLIDGRRYKVKRAKIEAELKAAERAHRQARASGPLSEALAARSPSAAFLGMSLGQQRTIVDEVLEVRLHAAPRGRKMLDPATVEVVWKVDQD